jgi:DNA-binding XRE family transcriptional regulator
MVQYGTASNRCRRCRALLSAPPPEPPAPRVAAQPNVAAGVRNWRQLRGLTQKQLANASQLPRTYISRIENGRIIPGLVTLERVAGALCVNLSSLLVTVPLSLLVRPPEGRHGNGNGDGLSGNGGHSPFGGQAGPALLRDNGNGSSPLDCDACLKELLRYSGLLTSTQRQMVLARVRQFLSAHAVASH